MNNGNNIPESFSKKLEYGQQLLNEGKLDEALKIVNNLLTFESS